jgi:hypothetical protein
MHESRLEIERACREVFRQDTNAKFRRASRSGERLGTLKELPPDSSAAIRGQHGEVGHEAIGTKRLVERRERFGGKNAHKPHDCAIQFGNEQLTVRLRATRQQILPMVIGHRVAGPEPRIDAAFALLQLNDTSTHSRAIVATIFPD